MGYRFLLWLMGILVTIDLFSCPVALESDCPSKCFCLSTYIDCSQGKLLSGPDNLPPWVDTLDFSSSKLSDDSSTNLSHLENLTDLKLAENQFTAVPSLGPLKSLRKMSLSRNKIQSISAGPLASLPQLEELNLNENDLLKLGVHSFPENNSIKILHMINNRISSIEAGAFDNLTSLIELKLSRNRLSALPKDLFANQKYLKLLELNKNQFREIDGLVFKGLENLSTLRLRKNKINSCKDAAFFGLKSLIVLQLDHNPITTFKKGCFYELKTLITLSMSYNLITELQPSCWEYSLNIEELDLSNNRLEGIYSQSFQHLSKLKKLKLDNNRISTIAENAFSDMRDLEVLQLAHNQISWTVEDMNGPFALLNKLVRFSLANNHIKSINEKAFLGLSQLIYLDLNDNNITSLQERSFDSLHNLKELHLNTSSLLCDCNLQWLALWLQKLPKQPSVKAICAYPPWFRGKHLLQMNHENFTCNDTPKPRILEQPKTQLAIKGKTAYLTCKAVSSSTSHLTFLWKRNDINISNPLMKESVETSGGDITQVVSVLSLPNITNSDAGKYQCIVSNSYGTTYSQKARITIVIFPKFIKTPLNITVKAGETAQLECAANGEPTPQIAWQKDGGNDFPAARERRMHVMPTDDVFFIINSKIADMGVYSCTAQNAAGAIISNATLTVLEAPSFVNAMENKEIIAGESVVLECRVSGSPKPTLSWLKDGAPIVSTERHFFTAEDQLLVIVGAMYTDEGLYECEISNSLGTKNDSTELRVLPPVMSAINEEEMMGIIIITVVCCAVATSIVWVVIIYHTRKRTSSALPQFTTDSLQLAPLSADGEHTIPHIFTDNVSERSSCKDSGTGDSAKRSSLEVIPLDDFSQIAEINAGAGYAEPASPPGEGHALIREECNTPCIYYERNSNRAPAYYPGGGAAPQVSPEVQQWFTTVDKDRSGHINAEELQAALVNAQGNHFSPTACRLMIGMFDGDRSGTINLEEFDKLYTYINQWLGVFHSYDRDQSGHIEEAELSQALTQMGFRFSGDFIKFLIGKSDIANKREVSVDQFIVLCVQIQRFTEAFRSRDTHQQGSITIGFEDFLSVALSCSI